MKDLGIIKSRSDMFDLCHNYISYSTLNEGAKDDELVSKALNHHAYAFGYSDYGGDEFDTLCCNAIKDMLGEEPSLYETTSYNGAQAIIFGELADKVAEAEYDPYDVAKALHFDLDLEMSKLEDKYINEAIDLMKETLEDDYNLTEEDEEWLYNWLVNNGKPDATFWDFSSSKCEEDFAEYKEEKGDGKRDDDDDEYADESVTEDVDTMTVGRLVCDKDSGICSILMDNGDSMDVNSKEDAKAFCKKHNIKLIGESVDEDSMDDHYPTAEEYALVVCRERAKKSRILIDKLREMLSEAIDSQNVDLNTEINDALRQLDLNQKAMIEQTSNKNLSGADKMYQDDMALVDKYNNK